MTSANEWLAEFQLGEVRWVETSLKHYAQAMRTINTPRSRRPAVLDGREFASSLYTAVSASRAGDIAYLIRIERIV